MSNIIFQIKKATDFSACHDKWNNSKTLQMINGASKGAGGDTV